MKTVKTAFRAFALVATFLFVASVSQIATAHESVTKSGTGIGASCYDAESHANTKILAGCAYGSETTNASTGTCRVQADNNKEDDPFGFYKYGVKWYLSCRPSDDHKDDGHTH